MVRGKVQGATDQSPGGGSSGCPAWQLTQPEDFGFDSIFAVHSGLRSAGPRGRDE